jgi:hypothetical protein
MFSFRMSACFKPLKHLFIGSAAPAPERKKRNASEQQLIEASSEEIFGILAYARQNDQAIDPDLIKSVTPTLTRQGMLEETLRLYKDDEKSTTSIEESIQQSARLCVVYQLDQDISSFAIAAKSSPGTKAAFARGLALGIEDRLGIGQDVTPLISFLSEHGDPQYTAAAKKAVLSSQSRLKKRTI